MAEPKKRLGRGLEALLSSSRMDVEPSTPESVPHAKASGEFVAQLPLEKITRNPYQPRQHWDDDKLRELAESIKANGLVQPVIVRSMGDSYQLIAGERRLRASELAQVETITAIVRDVNEEQMMEWALIENIHRADLNPVERAKAYHQYLKRFELTQQEAAQRLGEDRSTIANYVRLLDLDTDIRQMIVDGQISMGHARALLGLDDAALRKKLALEIIQKQLSVREVEKRIKQQAQNDAAPPAPQQIDPYINELQHTMSHSVGTKVIIKTSGRKKHKGKIVIDFYSLDDFDRICEKLGVPPQND